MVVVVVVVVGAGRVVVVWKCVLGRGWSWVEGR